MHFTVHQIHAADWDRARACVFKAGSGWHQAKTTRSAEFEQVRGRFTMSGHNALHQVGTLGPVSGGGVASWVVYRRWAPEDLPTRSASNH